MLDAGNNKYIFFNFKKPLKVIAVITLWSFLFTLGGLSSFVDQVWAVSSLLERTNVRSFETSSSDVSEKFDINTFILPSCFGTIREKHIADTNKIIIHVQDAHCNYEAQNKIADIISFFESEFQIDMINLEGGIGKYELSIFTDIEDTAIRKKVINKFIQSGLVSGAEEFAANNTKKVELWGIEDIDLYLGNLKAYRDSLSYKEEVDIHIKTLTHIIENLKRYIYSDELLELDNCYKGYKSGEIDFKQYFEYLIQRAESNQVDLNEFPNIDILRKSLKIEEKIDFKKANNERDEVVEKLRFLLSKKAFQKLLLRTFDFKGKIISQKDYYTYLVNQAKLVNLDLKEFLELDKYLTYVSLYYSADKYSLMREIKRLEELIKNTLYTNEKQKQLNKLSNNFVLIKSLFAFSLTKEEYRYYRENERDFEIQKILTFIEKETPVYGISVIPDKSVENLDDYRERTISFYEGGIKRDNAFINNLKFNGSTESGNEKEGAAILVTGGFHTENLCELFRGNNISYISIIPNFKNPEGYESPYFRLLDGREAEIQRKLYPIFAAQYQIQIASMLSNVIASEVWGKANIDSFRAAVLVQEQIAKGRDIFDIKKDGENVIFYMSDGTSELLSIRVLLDAVHQRDIDGQMEILPEENFKDIENINDILDEIKGFLGSIGADQKILDSVDALKGNNIDGGALVRTVEGITFRGHAGGQGIRINADLKEKAMKTTIIHEIIAGLYGDHFLAGRVEIAYLADNTNQKILAEETFLSNAIWNMTPDERLMVDRDFSARDASQRNKIVAVLRQHLDEIFSQDSLRNTFHTMAYWEDVFRKAGALELFNEAQPIIRELIKSGRTVYNSGNWHTGKDLIKPMISKLGEFSEEGKTIALERAEKVSITTRRARGQSQDPKSALRDIMGEIITQKQRTNSVFLPIIRIQNGLITGLIYDRNAVRAFEETLSSLGLKPALGSVVAAEFEEAVEAFPQRIVVDNAASVDRFLRYLAERYGVGEQEEASEEAPEKAEDVTITEINQIIERIRSQAPDPNAVERTIRDVVEPWLLRMSQEEAGRMLFELNEKCLISLGYVIQISPVGRRDEKWIVLYKAYKIEEIDIQGESVDVLYLRQVTRFSDGILRGNPGWSDFKQKYVAVFTESIEQEVDKVIMPALRNGELPFKGIRRSSEYANIQQLAEISLQLLQKEFSGKSRQEIIELIEESTKRHEVRHKRNEITKNREWGDSINGLDEETSAELDALRVAPYYNIFQLIQLSLSQQSYKLPFNVFGFLGKEIGSPFIPRGRDLGGLINWLVGKKGIGGFFAKQGVIDLTRSDLERKAIAASERFERDVNIADIGLDAVEHRVVNEVVRKAAIEGRLEDRGEVNGKRIIVIKGIDFLVANQRGHAGVERNVVYIAEGAFNDTLVLHEAIELQKWQEKALELAGVDVITDWNSLTNRQRREYKQLLRQWIRDNIFEARKLEERYHKEANLSANVEAGEVVEDSYVEDSLSEIKDPIETRKTAVEKLLSSIQGKSMIVKTIAGIPSSEEAPEFVTTVFSTIGDVNRDLAKSGFGIVKSTAYSQEGDKKQIVTFALYANNPQATQENIKKAVDIANRLFRDQLEPGQDGHIVLFAPQMDQGRGPQVALNVQENYKTENNITVVPDAYTDYNLGEKQYPDIQARGALARHIAFGRICERNNNIVGRDIALEAIKEFLMRESGNENLDAIKTIEDLLKVENTLRIRAIDYQEIVQWAESQKAVDTSL